MNKWAELFLGLIFIIGAIIAAFLTTGLGAWDFWSAAWIVLKGGVFWVVAGVGALFILLGISDLKG